MRRILLVLTALALSAILVSCAYAADVYVAKANPDTKIAYTSPVWSPDGRSIAYVGATYAADPNEPTFGKTDTSVYIATASGGKWTSKEIAKNADWPVWSADGKKLMITHSGLATVDVATGKLTQLTKRGLATNPDYPLSWSPNGRYVVYISYRNDVPTTLIRDIKAVKDLVAKPGVEGFWMKDGKLLTSVSSADSSLLQIIDPVAGKSTTLSDKWNAKKPFVPKGKTLAWVLLTPTGPHGEGAYSVDLKKGTLVKQTALHALELDWSPDASQYTFITMYSPVGTVAPKSTLYVGDTGIWKFKIAAKDAAKTDDKQHQHVQWAPNGKSIAYVTELGDIKILKL